MRRSLVLALLLCSLAGAQDWQRATDGRFTVEIASSPDREGVQEVFAILQEAARDLARQGLTLPAGVRLRVHPTLQSFTTETGVPWFVAATADRGSATLHTQRLRVLLERGSLEATLRHELFHLAQPADWPRWRAEGEALRFAGEHPSARPLPEVSAAELDALLAAPPDREMLARAVATAYRQLLTRDGSP